MAPLEKEPQALIGYAEEDGPEQGVGTQLHRRPVGGAAVKVSQGPQEATEKIGARHHESGLAR